MKAPMKDTQTTEEDSALSLFNPEALKRLRGFGDAAKREEALQALVHQMGQAITDLVERLEESDPQATADRLAAAMKALTLPAPQVTVHMDAPQVTLEATIPPAPPPVIHLIDRPQCDETWEIRIKSAYGVDKVMTITRKAQGSTQISRAPEPKRLAS